jgi:hypothetical protein
MQSIFSKADGVIAWLGPDYNRGAEALRTLERLSNAINLYPNDFE